VTEYDATIELVDLLLVWPKAKREQLEAPQATRVLMAVTFGE